MKYLPRHKISTQFLIHFVLSILVGLLWFWMLYDRFPLYFTHVNWIYSAGGDVLQHQLGWEWFRHEPWQFPLGKITAYGYPFGTSVTFMDAIPLFAIPFKLLAPWFKPNFQYFGIWELSSVIGQMLAGLLILHEFTRSYALKILGASLLVLSPPMIFRAFYHSSLSAHWILLLAIWFILLEYRARLWRGSWALLFTVAVLIHVYFIPMLIPLWMIGMFFRYKRERKSLMLFFDFLTVIFAVLLVGYSIGLFSLSTDSVAVNGFGVFSWNLNGFANPFSFSSSYMKEMVTGTGGQYEGFSYLGLGSLLLLPVTLYLFLEKKLFRRYFVFLLPLSAAAIVYTLFALSNKAYFYTQPLWDIQLSDSVLTFFNLFRTSGRFIWPVFYFLVLFIIFGIIRNIRYPVPVLLLVLLLQYSDLQPLYQAKKLSTFTSYESNLKVELWKSAAVTNKHIVIIPAKKLSSTYEPIALYAVRNHLTLNLGYFARSDANAFAAYRGKVWEDLQANRSDAQTIYLITDPEWINLAKANFTDQMIICELDGYTVLFSADNELAKTKADLSPYCSLPTP